MLETLKVIKCIFNEVIRKPKSLNKGHGIFVSHLTHEKDQSVHSHL